MLDTEYALNLKCRCFIGKYGVVNICGRFFMCFCWCFEAGKGSGKGVLGRSKGEIV